MQSSKSIYLLVLSLLLSTALLFAGGQKETEEVISPKTVELTVWQVPNHPEMEKLVEGMLQDYEKENNVKVSVNVVSWGELDVMWTSAIQARETPAFGYIYDFVLPKYARSGGLEPLDQYFTQEELSKFFEEPLKSSYHQGHLYAIPCLVTSNPLIYNKDHFADAGIEDPNDPYYSAHWDEFLGWCRKLKSVGYGGFDYGFRDVWDHDRDDFFMRFGARLTNEDDTKMTFNSPEGLEAARAWKDLAPTLTDKALTVAWNYADDFFAEKSSMMEQGAWMTKRLVADYPDINWGVMLPWHAKEYKAYLGIGYYAVFRDAKNKAEVIKLLKYMTSAEHSAPWNEQVGGLPAIKGAAEMIYQNETEANRQVIDMMLHLVASGQAKTMRVWQGFSRFANEIFNPNWQAMMLGRISPEEFVKRVDEGGNRVIKEESSQ